MCPWTHKVTIHTISLFCSGYMRLFKHRPSNKCCCARLTCCSWKHPRQNTAGNMCTSTLRLGTRYFTCVHRKHKIEWPICRILSATQTESHSTRFKAGSFKNSPVCFLMLPAWASLWECTETHGQVKWDQPHKAAASPRLHPQKHTVQVTVST